MTIDASTNSLSTIKDNFAAACKDSNKIPGAILAAVDRSGKLLLHESAGLRQVGKDEPIDKDALCWMASCTKLITAIACMQLVEQGKLQLDEPISKVLPEINKLESNTKTKTTLRHLLCHTSGQSYPFFNHDTEKYFSQKGLTSFGCTKASIYAPLNSEPGVKWEYGSSIDWAGQAVEKVSGLSLDAYFKKYIFEPCGIKNMTLLPESGVKGGVKKTLVGMNFKNSEGKVTPMNHVIEQDESKIEIQYGGAGAYGNAAEYCQILAMLLNEGTHPVTKNTILKPETYKELMRDQLEGDEIKKGLYANIPAAQPELTNPVTILEGADKNWALSGCNWHADEATTITWWAGIANHYWFLDPTNGVAAMIQCQIFPFFDGDVLTVFFGQILPELQKAVKSA